MFSKNTIKYIQSLRQKKFRQKYNNFFAEGTKSVREILSHPTIEIEGIYALPEWVSEHESLLIPFQSIVYTIKTKDLQRISNLTTPNRVLCICKTPKHAINPHIVNQSLTLYLDNIQNPGNMGSILRIADWFGIPYIWCSMDCVEVYNPKVIQASMGAFLRVATIQEEFENLKAQFPDLPIFASALKGQTAYSPKLPSNAILVIGNEGQGIRPSILQKADFHVTIPKGKNGHAESLNAAVATGILCSALIQSKIKE